jgi:hypothetical protein
MYGRSTTIPYYCMIFFPAIFFPRNSRKHPFSKGWLFPPKVLNAVLDMDTGKLLEMWHLLVNPKYKELWGKSYATELGCLAQGIPRVSKSTDTIRGCTGEFPSRKKKTPSLFHVCKKKRRKKKVAGGKKRQAGHAGGETRTPSLADYFSTPSY